MKKVIYIVKLGHARVTMAALEQMSRNNVEELKTNPAFPTTVPRLDDLTAAADRLHTALNVYRLDPSPLRKSERDAAFLELKTLRMELGNYVQAVSQGDKELINSAGFEVTGRPQPAPKPSIPGNVRAKATEYPNEILVNFNGVGGKLY